MIYSQEENKEGVSSISIDAEVLIASQSTAIVHYLRDN